jgi:hypothetical protein
MLKNNGFHNRHSPFTPSFGLGTSLALDFIDGTNTLSPAITFTRTTNATVTGSNGLIQNAPMNLLTFSEQFDNAAWTKGNASITANSTVAPNGTTTADTATATAANGVVQNTPMAITVVVDTTYTASVYVKRRTGTGVVQLSRLDGTYVTLSVTDEWQRFTVTSTAANTTGRFFIRLVTSSDAVDIWGAQLEASSTATTYNPTTVKNLIGFAENFDNAAWTKSNATITSGFTDIYGQPFAQRITATGANATVLSSYTAVASTPYTFSVYLQRVSGTGNVDISVDGTTWVTQTLTTTLQRFSVTGSSTAGAKTPGIRIVASGDVVIAFGAQLSDSASVDPYVYQPVAAPASTAYYGPRFDYDPVTLAPKGLLIEEQRTQLLLNSSLAGTSLATQNVTVTAVAHTLSFYGTGTVTLSGTSTAGPLVGTGAYPARSTLTFTPTAGTLTLTVTGTVQFAQLEIGAFATSFIPSAASQVTRAADSASMLGNNFARWYNVNTGTLFVQGITSPRTTAVANAEHIVSITSTLSMLRGASSVSLGWFIGSASFRTFSFTSANALFKSAGAYLAGDNAATLNGGSLVTDSGSTYGSPSSLFIGANSIGILHMNGHIARIAYYNRRLADSELQGITA